MEETAPAIVYFCELRLKPYRPSSALDAFRRKRYPAEPPPAFVACSLIALPFVCVW